MPDENEQVSDKGKAKNDEPERNTSDSESFADDDLPGQPRLSGGEDANAIDADFSDVAHPAPAAAADDKDAIEAEVVPPAAPPPLRMSAAIDDPLETLTREIPANTDITIVVKRKPDDNIATFRIPNDAISHVRTIQYKGQPLSELYDFIQSRHGGGIYHFQLRYDGGMQPKSWVETITDPDEPSRAEVTARRANGDEPERREERSQTFAPPTPALSEDEMADKFFDRLDKWTGIVDRLRPPAPAAVVATAPERSVKDEIALTAVKTVLENDRELAGGILRKSFGLQDGGRRGFTDMLLDVAESYLTDPAKAQQGMAMIGSAAGFLMPSLFGRRGPVPPSAAMRPGLMPAITVAPQPTAAEPSTAAELGIVPPEGTDTAAAAENDATGPALPVETPVTGQEVVW